MPAARVERHARRLVALVALVLASGLVVSPHPGTPGAGSVAGSIGRAVDATGVVVSEPDVRGRLVLYSVSLSNRSVRGRTVRFSGTVQVRTSAATELQYGDRVELRGVLRDIPGSAGATLRREGVGAELSYPKLADLGPTSTGWRGSLVRLRETIENGIDQWLPEPEAALLIAIALGARSATLGDLVHPLVVTGLIHLIAISGIKVSLLAGMAYQATRPTGRRLVSSGLPIAFIWLYIALTGFTTAGTRSAIMWTLVFMGSALGRKTVPLVSLGIALALMVLQDSTLLWDTAFQLTALGVFFIVAFSTEISRLTRFVPPPFGEALSVTIAAQLGTLPVVIAGFGVASSTAPIANALVLPLVPMLIVLGLAVGALAPVTAIAAPLAGTAALLCSAIVTVADFLAAHSPPYALTTLPPAWTVGYYVIVVGTAVRLLHRAKWVPVTPWRGMTPQFIVTGMVAVGGFAALAAHGNRVATVQLLGVGQSALIQSGGRTVLIDGGPDGYTLLERLGQRLPTGQRSIDLVVDTDPRANNVLGLAAVTRAYRIGEVLDAGAEYPGTTYAEWRSDLDARHIPTYALRTGVTWVAGRVRFQAIDPDGLCPLSANCVGMIRLTIGTRSVLLAGAASLREQHEAVFRSVAVNAEVLVSAAPALDQAFRAAVRPASIVRDRLPAHVVLIP